MLMITVFYHYLVLKLKVKFQVLDLNILDNAVSSVEKLAEKEIKKSLEKL